MYQCWVVVLNIVSCIIKFFYFLKRINFVKRKISITMIWELLKNVVDILLFVRNKSHHFSTLLLLLFESRLRKLLKYPSSKVMNYPKIERSFLEILSIFRVLDAFLTTPTSMLGRWKILRERVKILSLNSSSSIN